MNNINEQNIYKKKENTQKCEYYLQKIKKNPRVREKENKCNRTRLKR